jgi:hypothetical protein
LLDLARVAYELANLANVKWVIVTFGLCLWVDDIRVFPCLQFISMVLVVLLYHGLTLGKAP